MKRFGFLLLAIGLCLTFLTGCGQTEESGMTIDILQIGKADRSILSDGAHVALIDCGEEDDSDEILEKLAALRIQQVDHLIVTHFDKDHIGGAAEVIRSCRIGRLLEPDHSPEDPDAKAYRAYREAISQAKVPVTAVTAGLERKIGDIEKQRVSDMQEEGIDPYDLLMVPHHGDHHGKLPSLFSAVDMEYAVITCSEKEPPEQQTLDALRDAGCQVLCLKDWDIHIVSTESGIKIRQ